MQQIEEEQLDKFPDLVSGFNLQYFLLHLYSYCMYSTYSRSSVISDFGVFFWPLWKVFTYAIWKNSVSPSIYIQKQAGWWALGIRLMQILPAYW
jgi:hypothetical protein